MMRTISLLFLCLATACASTNRARPESESVRAVDRFVDRVAERIVGTAELRADLSTMRLAVVGVEAELAAPDGRIARSNLRWTASPSRADFEAELEAQLLTAFAERVHVFDAGSDAAVTETEQDANPLRTAADAGATHALLGSVEQRGDDLLFTVRLVDARTSLVIAAERVLVSVDELSDWTRRALLGGTASASIAHEAPSAAEPATNPLEPLPTTQPDQVSSPPVAAASDAPTVELANATDPPSPAQVGEPFLKPVPGRDLIPVRLNRGPIAPYQSRRPKPEQEAEPTAGPASLRLRHLGRRVVTTPEPR